MPHRMWLGQLVFRFALLAALAGLLTATGLTWWAEAQLSALVRQQVVARAIEQVTLAIHGRVTPADFIAPHDPEKLAALDARLGPVLAAGRRAAGGPLRIHLYAPDGTVLYSDLATIRGGHVDLTTSPGLNAALRGQVTWNVSSLSSWENADLKPIYGEALEVYAPVSLGDDIVGVYEVYEDLAPIHTVRPLIWSIGGVGALIFGAFLFVITRLAAERIGSRQAELARQAYHDPLSGLPNRLLFEDRLERAIARANRGGHAIAVLFMDLDNFKQVNDSLGHQAGDRLLVEVSARIGRCLRAADTAARLGGDEFAVLLDGINGPRDAISVAERILEQLAEPVTIAGQSTYVAASIGIALGPRDTQPSDALGPASLMREADQAMYHAKEQGKSRYVLFDGAGGATTANRRTLEAELRQAIERREFEVHYQPIVQLASRRLVGVEALVRWRHPRRGLLLPAEFLPVAEETGLVVPLGLQVLEEACRQARAWQQLAPHEVPLTLGVNLVARQFHHPRLIEETARVMRETGLPAASLELAIGESVLLQQPTASVQILQGLKTLGVRLVIDRFGAGYSALLALADCPIDALKLDRALMSGLEENPRARTVLRAIVGMARGLNVEVQGEGIETAEQASQLCALRCEYGQGFYFGHPLTGAELAAQLAAMRLTNTHPPTASALR